MTKVQVNESPSVQADSEAQGTGERISRRELLARAGVIGGMALGATLVGPIRPAEADGTLSDVTIDSHGDNWVQVIGPSRPEESNRAYCALLRLSYTSDPGSTTTPPSYPSASTRVEVVNDGMGTTAEGTTLDPLDGSMYYDDLTTSNAGYTLTPAKVWYIAIAQYSDQSDAKSADEIRGDTA